MGKALDEYLKRLLRGTSDFRIVAEGETISHWDEQGNFIRDHVHGRDEFSALRECPTCGFNYTWPNYNSSAGGFTTPQIIDLDPANGGWEETE